MRPACTPIYVYPSMTCDRAELCLLGCKFVVCQSNPCVDHTSKTAFSESDYICDHEFFPPAALTQNDPLIQSP